MQAVDQALRRGLIVRRQLETARVSTRARQRIDRILKQVPDSVDVSFVEPRVPERDTLQSQGRIGCDCSPSGITSGCGISRPGVVRGESEDFTSVGSLTIPEPSYCVWQM